jgi:hypothetical protein
MKTFLALFLCLFLWGFQTFAIDRVSDALDEAYLTYILSSVQANGFYNRFNEKYFPQSPKSPKEMAQFILDKSFNDLPNFKSRTLKSLTGAKFFRQLAKQNGISDGEKLILNSAAYGFDYRVVDPQKYSPLPLNLSQMGNTKIFPLLQDFNLKMSAFFKYGFSYGRSKKALDATLAILNARKIKYRLVNGYPSWPVEIHIDGFAKGATLRYDPFLLDALRSGGLISSDSKIIYVSTDFIALGRGFHLLYHEDLHRIYNHAAAAGYNSIARGSITSNSEFASGWKYGESLGLEELATYLLSLKILSRKYKLALHSGNPNEIAHLSRDLLTSLYFGALTAEQVKLVTNRAQELPVEGQSLSYGLGLLNLDGTFDLKPSPSSLRLRLSLLNNISTIFGSTYKTLITSLESEGFLDPDFLKEKFDGLSEYLYFKTNYRKM